MSQNLRIAVAQTPGTELARWADTRATIHAAIDDALAARAELLLLPECVWPAYLFGRPEALRAELAAGLPDSDAFLQHLRERARGGRMAICAGYVEQRGATLANAAALIDAHGEIRGVHRKCFLWDSDHACFEPGHELRPFDTPFGRIGVLICADMRLPEIPATLVARGARLLLQPTAWVNSGTPEHLWSPQADFIVRSRAAEFAVPIASADKCGRELLTAFVGGSLLCDAAGEVIGQAGQLEPEMLVAQVTLADKPTVNVNAAERDALGSAAARRPPADAADVELTVTADGYEFAGQVDAVALEPAEIRRFAPARLAAMNGAQIVTVRGPAERQHLCTRAAENRVFVLWLTAAGATLINPRGLTAQTHTWSHGPQVRWRVPVREAAKKDMAPQTDAFAGRRPEQYSF